MRKQGVKHCAKTIAWLFGATFFLVSLGGGAPFVNPWMPEESWIGHGSTAKTLEELERLGLLSRAPAGSIEDLLAYQRQTRKSLAEILHDVAWSKRLGLSSNEFKVTWYVANPFELLPPELQKAIQKRKTPFRSRQQVWDWCSAHKVSSSWRKALKAALVETTPYNLWRASNGQKPYARNGQFLEPIVMDRGNGIFEVRDGHIATDPRVIPTNTEMILLVRINGEERIVRVKATDIGGAIKGHHVDLPIALSSQHESMPYTTFPKEIRNPSVHILRPINTLSPNRKA